MTTLATPPSAPPRPDSRPTADGSRAVPGLLGALAGALTAAALTLDLVNDPAARAAAGTGWGVVTSGVGLLVLACAAPILARHPRHAVGWVMAGSSLLWALDGLAESWAAYGLAATPDLPLTGFAFWVVAQLGAFLLVSLPLLLVLYPDGRLLTGRWGRVSVLTIAMACSLPLLLSLAPASVVGRDEPLPVDPGMPALPLEDGTFQAVLTVAQPLTLLSLLLAVAVVFARQRRATGLEHVRLRWLVWAAVMCVLLTGVSLVALNNALTVTALVLCLGVTGVSVAVGILDPEITDVDALMGGTLVYAAVAAAVVGLDLALVAGLDAMLGERLGQRDVTLLVLLVAVAAYGPLRVWLGGLVRRVLVGRRGDRYDVVAGLAARLEASADVREQLPALATAVATAFKLGYVRVEVFGHAGGTLAATHGAEPPATREVPIHYGGEDVGRLVLPARGVRSMLSRRDQTLLFDVVRQAAIAVRSRRLAAELQQSREHLVLAREEDRRRIRRDLHDGLGPVLGGVALRLDAAGNAMESDPASARRMIGQSRQDVTDALADVRRLVHGLRPPALDDLGLVDALRQQAERTRSPGLAVDLDAADLPPLPAAVEVAAYRIASEALANTVRHAEASSVVLRLRGGPGELVVEVNDDGVGIARDRTAGVGLGSIRERAEELGGRAEISCPADGGTRVRAWLPVLTSNESGRSEGER